MIKSLISNSGIDIILFEKKYVSFKFIDRSFVKIHSSGVRVYPKSFMTIIFILYVSIFSILIKFKLLLKTYFYS